MWLTYLDESGNTGSNLADSDQPFHVVAGVCVREDRVAAISEHLDEVTHRWLGTGVRSSTTELHAVALKSGFRPWRAMPRADRIAVYREALAPLQWDGVAVCHSTVRKTGLTARMVARSPHLWALQFLIEKLDAWCCEKDIRTLLVADESTEYEQITLDLVTGLQAGGMGSTGSKLGRMDRIIDTVHFVRSETNRGVQLADLVAYLRNRTLRDDVDHSVERALWDECVAPACVAWRDPPPPETAT